MLNWDGSRSRWPLIKAVLGGVEADILVKGLRA